MKRPAEPREQPRTEAVEVWLDDSALTPLAHMGRLHLSGQSAVRFEYANSWLRNPQTFALDPELALSAGSFFPKDSNFGIFMDSCPDRWGQVLMKRREVIEARRHNRARRVLAPWDFFLGVQDLTRMGALRFSPVQSNRQLKNGTAPEFVHGSCLANELLAAPPLTRLAELQAVALELTRKKVDDLELLEQWLRILVAPGASLGGARPKANLQGADGLWIAKFPAADDDHDWALREILLHELATEFGLRTSTSRVERIGHGYHTFITKRFDRVESSRRLFTSAMALLGKSDSEDASYLNLAEFLANNGVEDRIDADLHELFKRVLFNVATANRDDHLRNHGFIRHSHGWRLAPAYDINPSTKRDAHVLTIDDTSALPDLDTVMQTAAWYRVSKSKATADRKRLRTVLAQWETRAKRLGLTVEDRQELKDCFQF